MVCFRPFCFPAKRRGVCPVQVLTNPRPACWTMCPEASSLDQFCKCSLWTPLSPLPPWPPCLERRKGSPKSTPSHCVIRSQGLDPTAIINRTVISNPYDLDTYGVGQERFFLDKLPFSVKEVVRVEFIWGLPVAFIKQHRCERRNHGGALEHKQRSGEELPDV